MKDRKLSKAWAEETYTHPDEKHSGKETGTVEYRKRFGSQVVTVIAKEQIGISAWIDPPFPGTADERKHNQWKAYIRAPWWKKWLLTFKRSFGF